MLRIIPLIVAITFLSCSEKSKQKQENAETGEVKSQIELSGKVFDLGPSKKDCKIYAECDCCTSSLSFINEKDFVLVNYCLEEDIWTTGTYSADSNNLTLSFNQTAVSSFVDLMMPDSKPIIKLDTAKIGPISFVLNKCENGDVMLERKQMDDYKYGLRNDKYNEVTEIQELSNSPQFKLLKGNQ